MSTLELNGKDFATQTSSAEPVLASTVTGGAGLSGSTSLGTVTVGTLGSGVILTSFVGMIAPFAMTSPPTGWLACDGSAYNSSTLTQYASLYTAIGNTWGGSDGTDFQVPDLEGAFLRGTGSHATSNMADGNDFAGPSVGAFENDQFQDHSHKLRDGGGAGSTQRLDTFGQSNSNVAEISTNANGYNEFNGGGTPRGGDETRPFNAGVKYCIKY